MVGFPKSEDLEVAREMAERIVAAGGGRVERILLYGSRARGEARPDSDYDLLVVTDRPFSRDEEWRLQEVARVGAGIIPEVWTVSEESYRETRDIVGYLSYFASYDGIPVYERAGKADQERR